jgi:ATP-dependent Clp protease adapter protein ClpS
VPDPYVDVIDRPRAGTANPNLEPMIPPRYCIVLHNDSTTSPGFVCRVLHEVFGLSQQHAFQVMRKVHEGGREIVGTYPKDTALTKLRQAQEMIAATGVNARRPDAPCELQFTAEPETL